MSTVQIPEDIRRTLDEIKTRLREFIDEKFVSKGRLRELEKLWLALEFPEYIRYRDTEWNVHSVELTKYEDYLIEFITTKLRGVVPDEAIIKADLGYIMKFSTTSLRVRDLLYEALVEILSESENIKQELSREILDNVKLLSRESKELALIMYLDGDIVNEGKLILFNTFIETIYLPTIRIIFRRRDMSEDRLREAVTELVKYGLIAHASYKYANMLINMYIVPPFLQDVWRNLPLYLDIAIPKFRAVELDYRSRIHEEIDNIAKMIDQGQLEEAKKKLRELKSLVDKALLT